MKHSKLLPVFVLLGALSLWLPRLASALTSKHSKPPALTYQVIVPTSEKVSQIWKYTTTKPAKNWFTPAFNDTAWKQGPGGFGTNPPGHGIIGTPWKKTPGNIWLRRTFNPGPLTPLQITYLFVRDFHDEDIDVYINGVPAYSAPGFITSYEYRPISKAAKQALLPNTQNELAVHCRQTGGGQYIDVGISERIPKPAK